MATILIAASLILLYLMAASRWPVQTALGVYAALMPFDTVSGLGHFGGINFHVTWFIGIAGAIVLLLTGTIHRGFRRPPAGSWFLAAFVVWAAMTAGWALSARIVAFRLPLLGVMLFIYLAAVCTPVTDKELDGIAWLSVLGGCAASAICLREASQGQYWVTYGVEHAEELTQRATLTMQGAITDPNILSASLLLPLALAIGLLLASRTWLPRLVLTASLGLIGTCILLTLSRGGYLASSVVLIVYLIRSRVRLRLLIPVAIVCVVAAAVPDLFYARIMEAMEDRGAGRIDFWVIGLELFRHHGVLGIGLDNFPSGYDKLTFLAIDFKGFGRPAHNIYVSTAVELGSVGFAMLVTFLLAHVWFSVKATRTEQDGIAHIRMVSYEAAFWGLLMSGFFLEILWEGYLWMVWMLLIMGAAARMSRNRYPTSVSLSPASSSPVSSFPESLSPA